MLAKKKKLSKKEIQEDQLVTSYVKSMKFFEDHQSKILMGIGAIILFVAAIFLYTNKVESDNEEATALLAKIMPSYDSGNFQLAIDGQPGTDVKGLKEIADGFSSVNPGSIAALYLGHSYFKLGKYEEALKAYDSFSGGDALLKAASLAGVANCYEALDKKDKAADYFKDAASVSKKNIQNAEYLLKAGLNYLAIDKKETAKKVFMIIKKDYESSSEGRNIERYLSMVE
ncbi:MAG: tetratricopeptide repeat protein [Melioribacteraceae bacterium]|nr:tetratricopeptide repeat protein [Melioribacteraceae bacterium]